MFNIKGPAWRLREHNGLQIAATDPIDGGAKLTSPTASRNTDLMSVFGDRRCQALIAHTGRLADLPRQLKRKP